jgi:hypothetical protein
MLHISGTLISIIEHVAQGLALSENAGGFWTRFAWASQPLALKFHWSHPFIVPEPLSPTSRLTPRHAPLLLAPRPRFVQRVVSVEFVVSGGGTGDR